MSSEYNSKLISKLYLSQKFSEIEQVLREIEEIADPVFIRPLFDVWSLYNLKDISSSHYFISTLQTINSKDVLKIALDIFSLSKTIKDKMWVYPIFTKYNYFENKLISYAQLVIKKFSQNDYEYDIHDFNLFDLCMYIKSSKKESTIQLDLRNIFLNSLINIKSRETSLRFLLRINPKEEFNYLIENYDNYHSDEVDILLSKELKSWSGGNVPKLIEIIIKKGCDRAVEIIKENNKEKLMKQKKTRELEDAKYSNIQVISNITTLRSKINTQCIINEKIKIKIFNDDESLINQMEAINNNDLFISKCSDLRDMFNNISTKVKYSLNEEDIKKILPGQKINEFSKPINRLILFLYEKRIKVDENLFGLRNIYRVVNLATHPEEVSNYVKSLKDIGLIEIYKKEEWSKLHQELLIRIKDSLEKFYLAIKT